jgi:hypothetical protein
MVGGVYKSVYTMLLPTLEPEGNVEFRASFIEENDRFVVCLGGLAMPRWLLTTRSRVRVRPGERKAHKNGLFSYFR